MTTVLLDDSLVEEARSLGNHPSAAEAATAALRDYIARRRQGAILDMFGKIEFDAEYDYKRERRRP